MEHLNQPRGDARDIPDQPSADVAVPATDIPEQQLPQTFREAEARNPFRILVELHEHALSREGEEPAAFHLTELALSAAVVAWWSRWQPISMHRAFMAGASLAEVAKAVGTIEIEAYQCWSTWADAQAKLIINGRRGVDPAEVAAIRDRLGITDRRGAGL